MSDAKVFEQKALKGKLLITGILKVKTGLHIGAGGDFAPIGAVDSPFIRDTLTHKPLIPGSSVKGKIRTLLAKNSCSTYVLNDIEKDSEQIKRCFGASGKNTALPARLQFFDLFVREESCKKFENFATDTYLGEVKFENTISRTSGSANPRQIERVPAGIEFDFKLVYNIEKLEEVEEDLKLVALGFELLQMDYLGGHGSRGYGRVELSDLKVEPIASQETIDTARYNKIFECAEKN